MEREGKYKHFLEPIRDLSENWDIDIASELQDYLEELESIAVSFDGGESNLNFAEAALMIQQSACVYSKKVEYLYSLITQTLNVAQKRRALKSSLTEDGVDLDCVGDPDLPHLLPLDDLIQESTEVDLKEEDLEANRASNLLVRAPISLLALDNGTDAQGHFKISNCVLHPSGALLLSSETQYDDSLHTPRHAVVPFGTPAAVLLTARKLGLAPGSSEVDAQERARQLHQQLNQDEQQHPQQQPHSIDLSDDDNNNDFDGGNNNNDDSDVEVHVARQGQGDGDGGRENGNNSNGKLFHEQQQPQHTQQQQQQQYEEEHGFEDQLTDYGRTRGPFANDPWAVLDPHDPTTIPKKPFKKGKIHRVPSKALLASLSSHPHKKKKKKGKGEEEGEEEAGEEEKGSPLSLESFDTNPLHQVVKSCMAKSSFKVPYFAEFVDIFLSEVAGQRAKLRRETLKQTLKRNKGIAALSFGVTQMGSEEEGIKGERVVGGGAGQGQGEGVVTGGGGGGTGGEEWGGDNNNDDDDDDDEPTFKLAGIVDTEWGEGEGEGASVGGEEGGEGGEGYSVGEGGGDDNDPSHITDLLNMAEKSDTRSYEDLCRQHVEAFMSSASTYGSETALSAKIRDWQAKVQPKLEEQEERKAYDIHEYGATILSRLHKKVEASELPQSSKKSVDFAVVVEGERQYEVCRFFLAALQLANSGNVAIEPSSFPTSHGNGHSLTLRLLNEESPAEVMASFRAPSVLPKPTQPAGKAKRGRAQKGVVFPDSKEELESSELSQSTQSSQLSQSSSQSGPTKSILKKGALADLSESPSKRVRKVRTN